MTLSGGWARGVAIAVVVLGLGPMNGVRGVAAAEVASVGGAVAGAAYVPVGPVRVADTRASFGFTSSGPDTIRVRIAGVSGVPADAVAAAITVTADAATGDGYVTVFPAGAARPETSNVNFGNGETRANGAVVELGVDGSVELFGSVGVELIVDVTGAFVPVQTAAVGRFVATGPIRVLDTRPDEGPVEAGNTFGLQSMLRIPRDAVAVALNITGTSNDGAGFMTVFPRFSARPNVSTLNFDASGQTRAAFTIAPTSAYGVSVYSSVGTQVVVDVVGYFTGPSAPESEAGLFVATPPTRLLDTRPNRWTAGRTEMLPEVPAGSALVSNVTIVDPSSLGWVSAGPAGSDLSRTSTVNASSAGEVVANLAITPISASGGIEIRLGDTSANVLVDQFGYFTS